MILTVTPNPSLDLLFEADTLLWDDANRVAAPRRRPGGQGINVTRAVRALGGASVAAALLGGRVGDELERMLALEGTLCRRVDHPGETRTFVGVRETGSGRSLLLNPRGPTFDQATGDRIRRELVSIIQSEKPAWVAACGSIPPGLPAELLRDLGAAAQTAGARFVPDSDGGALLAAAPLADLLVPNQHEAARITGVSATDPASLASALTTLLGLGAQTAAITLGARGAVIAQGDQKWLAEPPVITGGSAVGAGDAFLAALLLALDSALPLDQVLRRAVATGTAVLTSSGDQIVAARTVEALLQNTTVRPLH